MPLSVLSQIVIALPYGIDGIARAIVGASAFTGPYMRWKSKLQLQRN